MVTVVMMCINGCVCVLDLAVSVVATGEMAPLQ